MTKNNKTKNLPIWLQSILNKLKRAKKDKASFKIYSPKKFFKNFLKIEKVFIRSILLISILGLLVFLAFYYFNQYNKIEFKSFYNNETKIDLNYFDDNQNILFLGIEKGEGGNNYTQFLQVLSYNKRLKSLSILGVDTYYLASYKGGLYTFRTLLNSINEADSLKLEGYKNSVESFLGIRLDGYIVSDTKELSNLITDWNISFNIEESYKSEDFFYQSGDIIKGLELSNYLFQNNYTRENNQITSRSINFTQSFLIYNRDFLNLLRSFWEIDKLDKVFSTDLSKESFLVVLNNLLSSELPFYTEIIQSTDGYLYDTEIEKALSGNFIEIDNKVSSLIKNLEIVKEGAKIEVLNGSSIPGFAGKNKRTISNAGGNIINSGNYPEKAEETVLYLNDVTVESLPFTIDYIKSLFPNISISKKEYKYNTIGNIILVLGDR